MKADFPLPEEPTTLQARVVRWEGDTSRSEVDTLAVEEPLEIRLAGCSVAVTMRTPGDDFDLATGFLFTEGIIRGAADIASIAHCPDDSAVEAGPVPALSTDERYSYASNIVNVNPTDPAIVDPDRWRRNFIATSSCGVCGKASIEAIPLTPLPPEGTHKGYPYTYRGEGESAPVRMAPAPAAGVTVETLYRLEGEMRRAQAVFSRTGSLHAAGLFNLEGQLLTLREDVGRHNAVDKVVGDALRRGMLPLRNHILMVSGRTSFEVVQKALMAGIAIVVAVSAPSSLAVDLAREANMTLIGFLRAGRFNVYAGSERVVSCES